MIELNVKNTISEPMAAILVEAMETIVTLQSNYSKLMNEVSHNEITKLLINRSTQYCITERFYYLSIFPGFIGY